MSLLDTIKNLINKLDGNKPGPEKEISTPKVTPQPVVEAKAEVKPEPQVAPKPQAVTPKVKVNITPSELEAKVVASLPPRPTDSSLKRHYDAMVQAKVEELLS